jgi:hypothetical protein
MFIRRVLAVAAASAAGAGLIACGASGSDPTPAGDATAPARSATQPARASSAGCLPHVRYASGQGAGGRIWTEFSVRVTSRRGCSFHGFPAVRLVDSHGRSLPTHEVHRAEIAVRPIVLRRGKPGWFGIDYRWNRTDGEICRPAPHAVVVRIPGAARSLVVAVDGDDPDTRVFTPCAGEFEVGPILG